MSGNKIFIGIPILNRLDLLDSCLRCIDVPAHTVIINNSTDVGFCTDLDFLATKYQLDIRSQSRNLGVAASWNTIIRIAMSEGYDRVFIGSNDTMLGSGVLGAVAEIENYDDEIIWHIDKWNFFLIHRRAIDRVGWFDENFYPAYCEDIDYSYRCDHLARNARRVLLVPDAQSNEVGSPLPFRIIPGLKVNHLGSQTIRSDKKLYWRNKKTQRNNIRYYKKKWGGYYPDERFSHPFNDNTLDFRFWGSDSVEMPPEKSDC